MGGPDAPLSPSLRIHCDDVPDPPLSPSLRLFPTQENGDELNAPNKLITDFFSSSAAKHPVDYALERKDWRGAAKFHPLYTDGRGVVLGALRICVA